VYGAVKGMIDIALKTGVAGDLTRRLVESSQGISIVNEECGTEEGILYNINFSDKNLTFYKLYGRLLSKDVKDKEENVLLERNIVLLEDEIQILKNNSIEEV
jgi:DNA-directed RNA polymerase subunit beta'